MSHGHGKKNDDKKLLKAALSHSTSSAQILHVESTDSAFTTGSNVSENSSGSALLSPAQLAAAKQKKAMQEKLDDINQKLQEVRKQRLQHDHSAHKKVAKKPVKAASPPKKDLYHPRLDLIMAQVVHSPYLTEPNIPYTNEFFRMHEKLESFRKSGAKITDIPVEQRPFDPEETKQKFMDEVFNANVSFAMPEDKVPASIRKSFAVSQDGSQPPSSQGSRQISRTNSMASKRNISRSESKDGDKGFPVLAVGGSKSAGGKRHGGAKGEPPVHPVARAIHSVREEFRDVIVEMAHAEEEREHNHSHSTPAEGKETHHSEEHHGTHHINVPPTIAEAKVSPRGGGLSQQGSPRPHPTDTHNTHHSHGTNSVPSSSQISRSNSLTRNNNSQHHHHSPRLLPPVSPRCDPPPIVSGQTPNKKSNTVTPIHALSPIAPLSRQHSLTQQEEKLSLQLDTLGIANGSIGSARGLNKGIALSNPTSARRKEEERSAAERADAAQAKGEYDDQEDHESAPYTYENDKTLRWKNADEEKESMFSPLRVSPAYKEDYNNDSEYVDPPMSAPSHNGQGEEEEYYGEEEEEQLYQRAEAKEEQQHEVGGGRAEGKHEYDQYYQQQERVQHNSEEKAEETEGGGEDEYEGDDYGDNDFVEATPIKREPEPQHTERETEKEPDYGEGDGDDYYEDDVYSQNPSVAATPARPTAPPGHSSNQEDDEYGNDDGEENKYNEPSYGDYDEDFD